MANGKEWLLGYFTLAPVSVPGVGVEWGTRPSRLTAPQVLWQRKGHPEEPEESVGRTARRQKGPGAWLLAL